VNPLHILVASMDKFLRQRNQPVLVEFTVHNGQNAGLKIDIPDFEM
jgi:hypothetical protein